MQLKNFNFRFERAALLLAIVAASGSAYPPREIAYQLSYDQHQPGLVSVRIDLPGSGGGQRILVMPRAIPMGYAEVQYDRFVEDVKAFSGSGDALTVARGKGSRWRLGDAASTVRRVEYTVNLVAWNGKFSRRLTRPRYG